EAGFLEPIQKKGHEALDPARLRQYMDRPDRLQQLPEGMDFFTEGLSARERLEQLEGEERGEKRRVARDPLGGHGERRRGAPRAGGLSPGAAGSPCRGSSRARPASPPTPRSWRSRAAPCPGGPASS